MPKQDEITTRFKVDISDLKKGIAEANQNIKLANAEFKKATAGMDDWSKSADGIKAKLAQLDSVLNAQKQKLSAYQEQLKRNEDAYKQNGDKVESLKAKLQELADNGVSKTAAEYKKYEAQLAAVEKEQENNKKSIDSLKIQILNEEAAVSKTEKELGNYEKELSDVDKEQGSTEKSADGLGDSVKEAGKDAEQAKGGFTVFKGVLSDLASTVIKAAANGLKNLGKQVLETGKNFEASMSNVAALSGAVGEDFDLLSDTAKKFGATTQFSASEAADALGYMALAGWDAKKSAQELGGVLNLAAASGLGLAEASDMVTDYLSAFSNSAMTATEFADKLAYAQANSNTSAAQLGEAYKNSAAALNAAGQDVETVTSLLASMANQGLKGANAGTSLAAVMRDLTAKMDKGNITIGKTKIAVQDAEGNYRDLTAILADVQKATDGMGNAQRAAALSSVFTSVSMKGLNLIFNEGIESAAAFEDELRNCDNSAAAMAKTMNDNLTGDMKSMQSAFEDLQLTLYDTANGAIRGLVQSVTSDLLPALKSVVQGEAGAGEKLGAALSSMLNNIIETIVKSAPEIIQMAKSLIMGLVTGLLNALPELLSAVLELLSILLNELSVTLPDIITRVLPQVVQVIVKSLPIVLKGCVRLIKALAEQLPVLIDTVVIPMIPQLIDIISQFLIEEFPILLDAAIQLFMALVHAIPQIYGALGNALLDMVSQIWNKLAEPLKEQFSKIWDNFVEIFSKVWGWVDTHVVQPIKKAVSPLIDFFKNTWEKIVNAFHTVIDPWIEIVKRLFLKWKEDIIDPVFEYFRNLWEDIKQIWEVVSGWFSDNVIEPVKTFFSGMWNNLTGWASEAWEGIKRVFSPVVEWFQNIFSNAWQKVKDVFSAGGKVFSGIKEGIENTFKTVVNALIDGINKIITVPFNAINNMLTTLKGITIVGVQPFNWINTFSVPQIPKLSRGGILDKGQLGLLEGSGAEAVVPLDQNKRWIQAVANDMKQQLMASGMRANEYTFNQTINAPKAPSRIELYRQTRNLLAFASGV